MVGDLWFRCGRARGRGYSFLRHFIQLALVLTYLSVTSKATSTYSSFTRESDTYLGVHSTLPSVANRTHRLILKITWTIHPGVWQAPPETLCRRARSALKM